MSIQAISWVLEESEAKLGARLVLLSIANHADRVGGNAFPSVETIAIEAGMSTRQVQRALPILEKIGELEIDRGGGEGSGRGKTHRYRIVGMCKQKGDNLSSIDESKGDKSGAERVTNRTGKGDRMSPEPSLTVQEPTTRASAQDADGFEEWFAAWWKRYPRYRRGAPGPVKKKIESLMRRGLVSRQQLDDGLARYLAAGYGPSKWAVGAAVWLNNEQWTVEHFAPPSDGKASPASGAAERGTSEDDALRGAIKVWLGGGRWLGAGRPEPHLWIDQLPDAIRAEFHVQIAARGEAIRAQDRHRKMQASRDYIMDMAGRGLDPVPTVLARIKTDRDAEASFGMTMGALAKWLFAVCRDRGIDYPDPTGPDAAGAWGHLVGDDPCAS